MEEQKQETNVKLNTVDKKCLYRSTQKRNLSLVGPTFDLGWANWKVWRKAGAPGVYQKEKKNKEILYKNNNKAFKQIMNCANLIVHSK